MIRSHGHQGGDAMRIECPHCRVAIDVVDEPPDSDITCPSCLRGIDRALASTLIVSPEEAAEPDRIHQEMQPAEAAQPTEPENVAPAPPVPPKRMLGRYELESLLGRGAFGEVWNAFDTTLHRRVALKLLRSQAEVTPGDEELARDARLRFEREARTLVHFQHPGIVRVYEFGEIDGRLYLASELIEGLNLQTLLKRMRADEQSLTPKQAAQICGQVAEALHAAHQAGIVHRDLKPANILMDTSGVPHVADFGLAKRDAPAEYSMTRDHTVLGTPEYMSPEQWRDSHKVGPASDIYSLGVILYELLTGRVPFPCTTDKWILLRDLVLKEEPIAPRRLSLAIPIDLESICLKCLEKEPARRFPTAADLCQELNRFVRGNRIVTPPITRYQRAWRWCQHKPIIAGLSAAVALSLLFGTVISSYFAVREYRAAKAADKSAKEEKRLADIAKQRAEDLAKAIIKEREATDNAKRQTKLAQRNLYVARIRLAANHWDKNDIGAMNQALESCRPEPELPDQRGWEWNFLWNFSHSERLTLKGHSGGVTCVAFSPDGNRIVSGSSDKTLKIWDAKNGGELLTFKGHEHQVTSVAFSPDGRSIVSGGGDSHFLLSLGIRGRAGGSLKVWDAENGQERLALKGHEHEVTSVGFSPDGKRIVSGSGRHIALGVVEGSIKVWDVESGVELLSLKQIASGIRSVSFSPDGKEIVAGFAVSDVVVSGVGFGGSTDANLKVWDAHSGAEKFVIKGHLIDVLSTAYSPSGQHIATGSKDKRIRVWDSESGQEILTLNGHTGGVDGVSFSPDGRRVVSGSDDKTLTVWDAPSEIPNALKGKAEAAMYHVARTLRNRAGLLNVAEEKSEEELFTLKGHTQGVTSVAFSPDGKRIISGSNDTTVKIWDNVSGQGALTLERANGSGSSVSFSPDGKRIVSGGTDKSLKVWDTESGLTVLILTGHSGGVNSVSYSPDGKWIVSGSDDLTLKLWDAKAGQEKFTLRGHGGSVRSVCFSPDGKRIVSGSSDRSLKVWDMESGREIATFDGHKGLVWNVSFSPDGKRIASGSEDRSVVVWDANNGETVLTLDEHPIDVLCVCFSPDGKRIVASSHDTLFVWSLESGRELLKLQGHHAHSVSFSPDGKQIISGGSDTVKVWDAESGEVMLTLKSKQIVESVCISPDGKLIVSGHHNAVNVWDGRPESESPDRVIDREARCALTFHREKVASREDLAKALRNDATLTTPSREKALVWATTVLLDEDAKALNSAAWQVVSMPGQPMDQYHVALHRVEAAHLIKHDVYYDGTLGAAQYRVGQYEESQRTLALVVAQQGFFQTVFGHHPHPAAVAFLAMVEHKLGHLNEARAWLDQLREIMKQPKWAMDREVEALFHEAKSLLGAIPKQPENTK